MWRWLLVLVIALAGIGAWLYLNPDEHRRLLADTPLAPKSSVTTAYKWKDASGTWQLTDTPPENGEYETLQYRGDDNIMPALDIDDEE